MMIPTTLYETKSMGVFTMNEYPSDCPQIDTAVPAVECEPRSYNTLESVFAWLCMLAGYCLCRVVPVDHAPLGGFLLIVGLFAATMIVLHLKQVVFPPMAWCAGGTALIVSAALLLCNDPLLHHLCFAYALVAYVYVVYASMGNALRQGVSDFLPIDVFKAAVVMPFCTHVRLFTAMFSGKAAGSGKAIAKVLIGLLAALVPTAAVLTLLSYDSEFSSLLGRIFDVELFDVFSHAVSIAFGIPIGMYLFAVFIANSDHEARDVLTEHECVEIAAKCRVISPLTVAAATAPLLLVYVIFFASQWQYYTAGFTGVLPEGFSYASFAREGFFQLCSVSVINLAMILIAIAVTKRQNDRPSVLLNILTPLYSVSTLILIATAIAKMVMYIDSFGLTQKRVYATWFMIVIALVFLIIAVGRFAARIKTVFVCTAVCVVMFAGLALSNVDGIIADYNVDRYLSGNAATLDVGALEDLDVAAVPALCRVYKTFRDDSKSTTYYYRVKRVLETQAARLQDDDVWRFTVPQANAKRALRDVGLLG